MSGVLEAVSPFKGRAHCFREAVDYDEMYCYFSSEVPSVLTTSSIAFAWASPDACMHS